MKRARNAEVPNFNGRGKPSGKKLSIGMTPSTAGSPRLMQGRARVALCKQPRVHNMKLLKRHQWHVAILMKLENRVPGIQQLQ